MNRVLNTSSYDGAEVCELVGLFMLDKLGERFGKENIGLYRDDGLAILKNATDRQADRSRKTMHEIFNSLGLKITAQTNQKVTNFLDITLDLRNSTYKPYKKPNDELLYVHSNSNHPPSVLKQLPTSINKRLSKLSCDAPTIQEAVPPYQEALNRSNFRTHVSYEGGKTPENPPPHRRQ